MFKDELRKVVDSTDGGLASIIMDFEGIPLETYAREETPFDIETVGAEVSVVVKAIERASQSLEAGGTKEVAVKSDKLITLIRVLNEGYFVVLALRPDGNLGQGRFRLRVAAPALVEELS
jgi:predicted regulator of Ras-like GTPase activity (Roadblock/LC7/MglB family)